MITTLRTNDSIPPERRFQGLPSITQISYGIREYKRPVHRFTGIYKVEMYNDAAEFIIKTNRPIPVQGSAPALFIGDIAVINIEQAGNLTYVCRLFDYKSLPDTAIIYWGWSYEPQNKVATGFQFNKKNLKRFLSS